MNDSLCFESHLSGTLVAVWGEERRRMSMLSLAIVCKTLLKFLASEEDAALDGAEGEVHLFGDFIVLVPGDVHGERNTVFVGKFVDCI